MNRRGFSLCELLISLMILSVLSVLLVGVIPASVFGVKAAGQRLFAANWARQEVEKMRVAGFDHFQNHDLAKVTNNGTDFVGKVEVTNAKDSAGHDLDPTRAREIRVWVEWKASGGGVRSYTSRSTLVRQR